MYDECSFCLETKENSFRYNRCQNSWYNSGDNDLYFACYSVMSWTLLHYCRLHSMYEGKGVNKVYFRALSTELKTSELRK